MMFCLDIFDLKDITICCNDMLKRYPKSTPDLSKQTDFFEKSCFFALGC